MSTLRYGDVVTSTEVSTLEDKLKKKRQGNLDTTVESSPSPEQPDPQPTNEPKRSK